MMRVLLSVFTFCIVLVACSDKEKVPGDVIPKVQMEKILWDMVQAERYSSVFLVKDSAKNVKEETFKLYEQIFSIHKTTKEEFIKSYRFYLSRPDIARVMFDSMASHANRIREEMNKAQAAADSAKAAKAKADTSKTKVDTAKIKTDTSRFKADTAVKTTLKPFPVGSSPDTARMRDFRIRRDTSKLKPIRGRRPKSSL